MTAMEIACSRAQSTCDQVELMHKAMKLMPDYRNDDFGISCLMAAAYNAGRAEALTDDGGALGYYIQEIVNTAQQITDAAKLKRVFHLARRLLGKQAQPTGQEARQKPTEPESWADKACVLLPQLSAEDQEVIYWRVNTMMVRRNKPTTTTPQEEAVEDMKFTLRALVDHEMADVVKPKTLDAILSYARVAKQREGRE